MKVVDTLYHNHIDFYLSFGIGLALAIFLISVWSAVKPLLARAIRGGGPSPRAVSIPISGSRRQDLTTLLPTGVSAWVTSMDLTIGSRR